MGTLIANVSVGGRAAWDRAAGRLNYVLLSLMLTGVAASAAGLPVAPLLERYCFECHDAATRKGELDLERFATVADIASAPGVWEQVLRQIEDGEMPPKKQPQFTPAEREHFTGWVQQTLNDIAHANAGDPGPVLLRRLSNHEYTYTIRDLTGVALLDPAREFPVDGAAGEGFSNVGAALVMSPALLTKYLDAAKEIAAHAVFTPEGMHWSASTSSQDWTHETLEAIRAIYARYSGTAEGTKTVKQGIKLDIGTDHGRLPLAKYLDALQGRTGTDGLSAKYLGILRTALTDKRPSLLLDPLRAKFHAGTLTAADIEPWQQVLWRFATVGHIGKQNGPKAWQEPMAPLVALHEMRIKLEGGQDKTLFLTTTDAGDGPDGDEVIWENPRLVAPGRPDLPIGDLPALMRHLKAERAKIIAHAEECLNAIAANRNEGDAGLLEVWREYLGFGTTQLEPLLTEKLKSVPNYGFIQGWKGKQALSVIANSSDTTVRVPGEMKGHSVATHPSPTLASVIAWRSPVTGKLRITANVADAHPECGNGVAWALEVRRGHSSEVLASGVTKRSTVIPLGPFENVSITPGQVVAFVVGPRDGNHSCDLTAVNLSLTAGEKTWDLARDVSPNILAGNPHGPWHFLSQPATLSAVPDLPAPVAEWRRSPSPEQAAKVRAYLEREFPLTSPLLAAALRSFKAPGKTGSMTAVAPSVIELKIPAALVNGAEFVVTGRLASRMEGSVQMRVLTEKPAATGQLVAGQAESKLKKGMWSDNNLVTQQSAPVIVNDGSEARNRFAAACDEFRALFPIALCYSRIVPVDEVVTLRLFYREDEHLQRLMLGADEQRELDRLWRELLFVSEAPRKQVDVFEQLFQFATQDAKPSVFDPLREPFRKAAAEFNELQRRSVAVQREAVIGFAAKAWRRPLTAMETAALREFPPRLMLVRVLTSPAFLYRGELTPAQTGPVSLPELATRLSYFLWSSAPDAELTATAAAGSLTRPEVLLAQTRRLIADPKIRRLATEFGAQWLHVRDVETLEEKSERHFPTFLDLREAMQEETVRFFMDLFQQDRSVLSLIDADHTFLNPALARHYGVTLPGEGWRRVDGMLARGRGGIFGFASTLAKHSGASRTSPILRGNWISEVILGDKLPKPPSGVPLLPDETPAGLTERELIERHSLDPACAQCHARIDPLGFALEGFDAIGRARDGQDTRAKLADGTRFTGLTGLRGYVMNERREDFLRQFARKLLGYALGRSVRLSDKPLLDELLIELAANDHRVSVALEKIVLSPQFRNARGRNHLAANQTLSTDE